uniref:NR LBD domain-containing protein n=1 Tax=Branchiostoma floridae TaxID=7739 RepID=C3XUQ6_BRAFL|eukprot:XP_002612246.1 hypothetical protein BRAFLDRAFT_100080 [Branchiostoma floridae]
MLQETLHKFHQLQVDAVEYACLKGIVLFKTDVQSLRDHGAVAVLQDQTQRGSSATASRCTNLANISASANYCSFCPAYESGHHIEMHKAGQPFRFGKLLLLLSSLRKVQRSSLESVFFTKAMTGGVSMDQLVLDMYKSLQTDVVLSDSYRCYTGPSTSSGAALHGVR